MCKRILKILILALLSHVLLAQAATDGDSIVPAKDDIFSSAILKKISVPKLGSAIAVIYDELGQRPLFSKNADTVVPIASITKLMTAMVVLDARLPLDELISIEPEDRDRLKGSRSRISSGMMMTRGELLRLALMASENRAAAALARTYPGGTQVVLAMMNAKAQELGMTSTRFFDPTGLHSENVSTAHDLVKMVMAAQKYDLIQQFTTTTSHVVNIDFVGRRTRPMRFYNTNPLVRSSSWDIGLSKTGYISEAGRCLVMQANILDRPVIIVLLDSWGKRTRIGDAVRVKHWMERVAARSARNVRRRNY